MHDSRSQYWREKHNYKLQTIKKYRIAWLPVIVCNDTHRPRQMHCNWPDAGTIQANSGIYLNNSWKKGWTILGLAQCYEMLENSGRILANSGRMPAYGRHNYKWVHKHMLPLFIIDTFIAQMYNSVFLQSSLFVRANTTVQAIESYNSVYSDKCVKTNGYLRTEYG